MTERFIHVEYDRNYYGGNYSNVGETAALPVNRIDEKMKEANVDQDEAVLLVFTEQTGLNRQHVVSYNVDELYDAEGNFADDEDDLI